MSWFSKPKPVEAARIIPERVEQVRKERGGAFAAINSFYYPTPDRVYPGRSPGDWVHIGFIWGWCRGDVAKAVHKAGGKRMDEGDFYLRLFSFVKMRGGKFHRFNQGIFVSARLPHSNEYRGALYPGGPHSTHSVGFLPDDARLIPALKKSGIDVRGLKLGGGHS